MVIDISRYLLLIFCVAAFFWFEALAEEGIVYMPSDRTIVRNSFDIVEGKVGNNFEFFNHKNRCFSYVFDFKIHRSWKEKTALGSNYVIGVNLDIKDINSGDELFLVLRELPKDFYEHCDYDEKEGVSIDYILSSEKLSTFKLVDDNFRERYQLSTECGNSKYMFDELATKEKCDSDNKSVMSWDKSILLSRLKSYLH